MKRIIYLIFNNLKIIIISRWVIILKICLIKIALFQVIVVIRMMLVKKKLRLKLAIRKDLNLMLFILKFLINDHFKFFNKNNFLKLIH